MAEMTVSYLAPEVNGNELKFIENNGQILFSAEEIGRQLGYKKPAKSINIIYNRNQKELDSYAVGIKLMSTDGKYYQVRHFTEEGVYILSMLANTPHAAAFRRKVAALLRQVREAHISRQIELAREAGYRQGFDGGRATVLPEVRKAQATARAQGAGAVLSLPPSRVKLLKMAMKYTRMGLTVREVARVVEADRRMVGGLLSLARKNGLLPCLERTLPAQGSLLELTADER